MVFALVLLTFAAFVALDVALGARRSVPALGALPEVGTFPGVATLQGAELPQGLFLGPGHTWAGIAPSGTVTVGADGLVALALGSIDSLELPASGREVRQGEPLFSLRQGKRSLQLLAPVGGIVTAVNEETARDPSIVAEDPYARGWICALRPRNLPAEVRVLRLAQEATRWMRRELERLRELLALRGRQDPALGVLCQDGGELRRGLLEAADNSTWNLFEAEFLRNPEGS